MSLEILKKNLEKETDFYKLEKKKEYIAFLIAQQAERNILLHPEQKKEIKKWQDEQYKELDKITTNKTILEEDTEAEEKKDEGVFMRDKEILEKELEMYEELLKEKLKEENLRDHKLIKIEEIQEDLGFFTSIMLEKYPSFDTFIFEWNREKVKEINEKVMETQRENLNTELKMFEKLLENLLKEENLIKKGKAQSLNDIEDTIQVFANQKEKRYSSLRPIILEWKQKNIQKVREKEGGKRKTRKNKTIKKKKRGGKRKSYKKLKK